MEGKAVSCLTELNLPGGAEIIHYTLLLHFINALIYICCVFYGDIRIQRVSRLVDITAGGDFLGVCDQKYTYIYIYIYIHILTINFLFPDF